MNAVGGAGGGHRASPRVLGAGAVVLAAVGAWLLLPVSPGDGSRAALASAAASAAAAGRAAADGVAAPGTGVAAAGDPQGSAPGPATGAADAGAAASLAGPAAGPASDSAGVPPTARDRLAGPVPDDEVAAAFADAVPAAPGLAPGQSDAMTAAASTGLAAWYGAEGWTAVVVQAAVVTTAQDLAASVAVLWAGQHPVLGPSERRLATVTMTRPAPDGRWAVDSVSGGPADG